ncbi:MAG: PEP-CTERM sorting domain-containing protein, partial [Planctomycetes bacterium]|nr:PEP-CTERM sorting domain-containing protein [Planctomycetota bacterium]
TGDGRDIWDADDGFYFVYQTFSATQPLDIWANVGLTGFIGGTDPWRKGGVMVRQSLVNNSRNSCTIIAEADANGINAQIRRSDGAGSEGSPTTGPRITRDTPAYLRVEYLGDGLTFRNYYKFNVGDPWTLLGTNLLTTPLTGTILGGLCVTSHNVNQLTTVRFGDVNGFILLEPSAGTLQWNPGAGSANWGTSNWLAVAPGPPPPPPGFPDGTITALLDSSNTVTVEADRLAHTLNISNSGVVAIGAGNTLLVRGPVNASPGATISLSNNATFSTGPDSDGGTLETLTTSALGGTATVNLARGLLTARRLTMGAGDTLVKAGAGKLTLDQSAGANTMDGTNTLRVNAGQLNMVCGPGPLNGADFILDGGTLELKGVQTLVQANALRHTGYHLWSGWGEWGMNINLNGAMMLTPPYGTPVLTGALSFANDAAFSATGAVHTAYVDNYSNLFTGYLNVTTPGTYTLRIGGDDDRSMIWLDLNQDGVFQSATGALASNNAELLAWEDTGVKTLSLAAGRYKVAVGHSEAGGGSNITAFVRSPTMGAEALIQPNAPAQAGLWSIETVGPISSPTTNFTVTASSTLRTVTDTTATLGNVNIYDGTTLTTFGGNATFGALSFTDQGAPGVTATMAVNNPRVAFSSFTDGGVPTTFIKAGPGTLSLPSVTAASGTTFRVDAGTLATRGAAPVGNADNVVLSGGTFEVTGPSALTSNALRHVGYHVPPDNSMNLHNNAGLLALPPSGSRLMNRDTLAFYSDTDFMSTGVVGQHDYYMNAWYGYINVTPAQVGQNFTFRIGGDDDRSAIWVDRNGDGIFTTPNGLLMLPNTGGGNTQHGELIAFEDTATKTVTFPAAGAYRVAVLHGEYTGGSVVTAYVRSPAMGAEAPIAPADPAQAGLWSTDAVAAINMSGTNLTVTAGTTTSRLRPISDFDATFASLTLGTGSTLTTEGARVVIAGNTTFNPGSTLLAGIDGANLGTLRTSGGQSNIGSGAPTGLTVLDNAYINPIVTANAYNDQGIAGSIMRIYNAAALVLDNNAPNSVAAGSTTFRVETGSMLRAAATPAATPAFGATGNPRVTLAGGTLSLTGTPDGTYVSNALTHYGFHTAVERMLNLDGTNGMMLVEGGLARVPYARVPFTNAPYFNLATLFPTPTGYLPGAGGLFPRNDTEFILSGAVAQWDYYSNVWLGYLNVTTPGNYEFRIGGQDDRAGIWLDRNQNGVFASTTGGLQFIPGTSPLNNGELIVYSGGVSGGDNSTKTYNLAAGQYLFAVTHGEITGGSNVHAYIKSPTMAAQVLINPADPTQAGLWSHQRLGNVNATNTNVTMAAGGTLVALTDRTATLGTLIYEGGATAPNAAPALPNVLTVSGGGGVRFAGGTNLTSPTPLTSYVVAPGQVGNQAYTGALGMDFDLMQPTVISRFGIFDSGSDGLSATLNVRLYDRTATATALATLTFSPGDPGTLIGGSRWKDLATPLLLPAGFRGSIVASGFNATDLNGNNISPLPWTFDSFNGSMLFVGGARYGADPNTYPTTGDGGPANRYAAGTFTYTPGTYSGINALAATTVNPGALNGGGAPNRLVTQGMGDVVLNQPGSTGLERTTIETRGGGGRLIVANPGTVAGATLNITGGLSEVTGLIRPGNLVLASPDGNDVTYPNRVGATAGGSLIAGTGGVGVPSTNALVLPDLKPTEGAIVQMKTTPGQAGYILLPNGVNSPGYTQANAIAHYGYHMNNDGFACDLSASYFGALGLIQGGMWSTGKPASFQTFYGKEVLTSGPGGRGLDYNDDYDFMIGGAVGQIDNYSNLFIGKLTVPPALAGTWNFRINVQDDPCGFWIDLNRNGQFDSSVPGVADNRGEQVMWNVVTTRALTLAAGEYMFAFTHREGGGGSQIEAQFQAPGMAALTMIKPSDPAQAGLWSMPVLGGGLDIAQGETRTEKALNLGTLILSPGGTLNRVSPYTEADGRRPDRDITVTERLELFKDLSMADGERLTTVGATVAINPGATLFIDHALNAADLNVLGNLARIGGPDVTVTRSMTLNSSMDFTPGGNLTAAGATLNVSPGGSLVTTAPIVARSLASSGTVAAPGATVGDLIVAAGTTTLSANTAVTNSLLGGNAGTLVIPNSITLDVSGAQMVNLNSTLRVDSGTLTINAPAGRGLPAGLQAYYTAIASAVTGTGQGVTRLYDLSDFGRDMANVVGNPTYAATDNNGLPAIRFYATDGADAMWTDFNFDAFTQYSVIAVDRLTGGANARVITSRTRNWLFGHHGGGDARWHAEGWITPQGGNANTLWDVSAGDTNNIANPQANFWYNGTQTTTNGQGSGDTNYYPGILQLGAWGTGFSEPSNAQVSDILIFNRVLTAAERNSVASYLASRYAVTAPGYTPTALAAPALLGDLRLAPSTSATIAGSGTAAFNSIGTTASLLVTGPMTLTTPPTPPTATASADGQTLTLNATISATNFNVSGTGTVALTRNLTIAAGGTMTSTASANINALNVAGNQTIDAGSASLLNLKGGLNVAAGTVTFRTPAPTAIPANLIGYWPFNEGTGTTTADASGGGNPGTLVGTAAWVNDPTRGWVLNLPANVAANVNIPAAALAALANQPQVTVSLWQYGDVPTQPRDTLMFEARNAAGNRVLNVHLPWSDRNVYWDAGNVGGAYDRINRLTGADSEFEGQWNNWIFTKNATTGTLSVYLNGAQWITGTGRTRNMEPITSFRIGADGGGGSSYGGMVDEFMVWNRSLTVAEIQRVYSAGLVGSYGPALLGNLTMAPGTTLDLANAAGTSGAGAAAFQSITTGPTAAIKGAATLTGDMRVGGSPGTLNVTGSFTMAPGSTYHWEHDGTNQDLVAVTGSVNVANAWNLGISLGSVLPDGQYNLFTHTAGVAPTVGPVAIIKENAYANLINSATVGSDASRVFVTLDLADVTTWTSNSGSGGTTAWNTATNWTPGVVPTASTNAIVQAPIANQIATVSPGMGTQAANNLIVDTGGHVRIEAGGRLEVTQNADVMAAGTLTVNGALKVGSTVISGITPLDLAGLMSYWPLNEAAGTTAADASLRGHTGNVVGTANWQPAGGRFGGAMLFNGATDIQVPYSADFDRATWTVNAWVNIAQDQGDGGILGTRFGGEFTFDYKVRASDIHGDVGTGGAWINTAVDIPAPLGDISWNAWHMVTYVIDDAAKQFRLYLDGALTNTYGYSGTPRLMMPSQGMRLGNSAGAEYLNNGRLDDVAIWDRALTLAEIQNLWVGQGAVPVGGTLTIAGTALFGGDADLDVPRIVVTGGTTTGWPYNFPTLKAGTTLRLAGGSLAGGFNLTNPSTTAGSYAIEAESGTSPAWLIGPAASLRKSTAGTVTVGGVVDLNNIRMEAGTLNLTNEANYLRANNVTVTGGTLASAKNATIGTLALEGGTTILARDTRVTTALRGPGTLITEGTLTIDASTAGVGLSGELRVTNTVPAISGALTINVPTPGTPDPNLMVGLRGYWPLNEGAGSTAFDLSGNARNGAISGAAWASDAVRGTNLRFDGTDDFVTMGALGVSGNAPRSIAGWAKSNDAAGADGDWTGIFGWSPNTAGSGRYFDVEVRGGGAPKPYCLHLYGREDNFGPLTNDPNWHFFAGTYDGTNVRLYLDGSATPVLTYTPSWPLDLWDEFGMGRRQATGQYFNGNVDDVAAWNRALSGAEIQAFRQGALAGGPARFGDLRLQPDAQLTLGGSGIGTFNSIGTIGGPTALGPMTLAGAANLRGGNQWLTVNGALTGNFQATGPGGVGFMNNASLTIGPGASLVVPQGMPINTEGNVTIDATQAATLNFKGSLNVTSGTLTLNGPAPMTRPTSNLVAYWGLDSSAAQVTRDTSGNSRDAILAGDAAIVPGGVVGGAMRLDDSGDWAVVPGLSPSPIANSPFSLSFWTKRSGTVTDADYVVGQGDSAATRQSLHVGFRDATQFTFAFYGDDVNVTNAAVCGDTTNWHHWVVTYHTTGNAREVWLDGVRVFSGTSGGPFLGSGTNQFWLGRRWDGNEFGGLIDEAMVFNRVLTTPEIQNLYRAGVQGGYGAARFGDLTMAQGANLVAAAAPVGFSSATIGDGATMTGDITVDRRITPAGTNPGHVTIQGPSPSGPNGHLRISDGLVYEWSFNNGPAQADLITIVGDLHFDKSFTLRVFGEGGVILSTDWIPVFYADNLFVGGQPWNPTTNPLQYTIDVGNLADPQHLYLWDLSDATLEVLGQAGDWGIYLTGLTALAVPEPSTLALLALGALALLRRRRRTR